MIAAEITEVGAEVISFKSFPIRGLIPLLLVPFAKFGQRLPIISLSVNGGSSLGVQMREKLFDLLIPSSRILCARLWRFFWGVLQ